MATMSRKIAELELMHTMELIHEIKKIKRVYKQRQGSDKKTYKILKERLNYYQDYKEELESIMDGGI